MMNKEMQQFFYLALKFVK